MTIIDMIILGFLYQEKLSAYDIQKEIEERNISKWIKISRPAIYKNLKKLEDKNYLTSDIEKKTNMPEKKLYSLTKKGKVEYDKKAQKISEEELNIFLDINSVISSFDNLTNEKQITFLKNVCKNIEQHLYFLNNNLEKKADIPEHGKQILKQQKMLLESLLTWAEDYLKIVI